MKRALLAATAAGALFAAHTANAALQVFTDVSGVTSTCVDNTACDSDPALGTLAITSLTVNGVKVSGSTSISSTGPDLLTTNSAQVINNSGAARTVTVEISDTDYPGFVSEAFFSGSGTWVTKPGHTDSITLNWYADTANAQGAPGTPGALLGTFTNTSVGLTSSFATGPLSAPFVATDPFSMTEYATFNLGAGDQLTSRGQTILAIPEPRTWVMSAIGFALLGMVGFRHSKRRSAARYAI